MSHAFYVRLRCALKLSATLACMAAILHGSARANTVAGDVTTYHNDNLRTGWNPSETVLTPANVGNAGFGLQHQVALDEQVDAQPLFMAGQTLAGHGKHNTVYVATENDTVYAIDADTGAIILSRHIGAPVPVNDLAVGGCSNGSNYLGINSTPVIDSASKTLYVMTYTYENSQNIYRLHALDLSDLSDRVTPATVAATGTLKNGSTNAFQARYERQRPALLEAAGNIYAGFGGFCDLGANITRGWLLGWKAGTLAPLPVTSLLNKQSKSANDFFLSGIWMSGAGMAADGDGNIFFATGNSDPGGKSYSPSVNIEESVVRISPDLTTVQDYFTPKDYAALDSMDNEIGSGGVLLLPNQGAKVPPMAVIAGKTDYMYLLNRDRLGHLSGTNKLLGYYENNGCWCAPSYFVGSDGIGRVVSSTGKYASVWRVQTTPSPALVHLGDGTAMNSGQEGGFFTSVSSNGTQESTAVVWALPHPADNDSTHTITLTAFNPAGGSSPIFTGAAGTWPFYQSAAANLVPVAAGGHVFVASYGNLSIFGLLNGTKAATYVAPVAPPPTPYTGTRHQLYGTVLTMDGGAMTLRTRIGNLVKIDMQAARQNHMVAEPAAGHAALVRGDTYDATGRLVAMFVLHAKNNPALWGEDR